MNDILFEAQLAKIDGKTVSFRRIGTGSRKILFFHGFPGSSTQIELFRSHFQAFDLDVICLDRPGYGRSAATGNCQFKQTTELSKALLASAGWDSFEVISVSGGTPFLFALTQDMPERISRATIISGLSPISTAGFKFQLNWKSRLALRSIPLVPGKWITSAISLGTLKKNSRFPNLLRYFLPISSSDELTLQSPLTQAALRRGLQEAFHQNGIGPKRDAAAFLSPWSCERGRFSGDVTFWHGHEDRILPLSMAQRMTAAISGARLNSIAGEGHYSLAVNQIEDILKGE